MPQNEQSSLEKAFLDFSNLKKHAQDELMGQLEEKVEEKLLAMMNEMESEHAEPLNEDVTVTVNVNGEEEAEVKVDAADAEDFEDVESPAEEEETEEMFEITSDAESYEITNEMNNHLEEQEPVAPEAAPAPAAPEAAPETAPSPEAAPAPEAAPEAAGEDAESKIIDGIKELISQDGGAQAEMPAAGEEIDIVDDGGEAPVAQEPVPGQAPMAEEMDVDEIFEIIDADEVDGFDGMDNIGPSDTDITWDDVAVGVQSSDKWSGEDEEDELYEITLDLDDEEEGDEELEEMKAMGQSHSVQRGAGKSAGPETAVKHRSRRPVNESKASKGQKTAHYEAKIAELNKENESLKAKVNEQTSEIKKFHKSFVELRSQFNEMQTFNAKLAYANKLFANGGFSQKEKLQIAESFDKVGSVKDAKQLYNSIISENKLNVIDVQKEIAPGGPKAAKPANPQQSQHNVLYESAEIKRMRQLAGIRNKS